MKTQKQPMTDEQIARAREVALIIAQHKGITVHDLFLAAEYMATANGVIGEVK